MDDENVPVMIPRAIPQTEAGWELYDGGTERRLKRLDQRQELINLVNSSHDELLSPVMSVPVIHIDTTTT